MATRLTFLCASATASSRIGAFPSPAESLDEGGARKAVTYRLGGPNPDLVVLSPSLAAIETAAALALDAHPEPLLADLDFGDWAGRTLLDVEGAALPLVVEWLADPAKATPGGESMEALVARVGSWMDRHIDGSKTVFAICSAAVMRAALSHALSMPLAAVMRIDIAPLASVRLSYHGQWRLQELRRTR